MDAAFMTTWTFPFPGREQQALEFAGQSAQFWSRLAAEGRCTEPEWFFFPDGINHLMVKGERRVLEELLDSDETRRILAAVLCSCRTGTTAWVIRAAPPSDTSTTGRPS